MKIDSRLSVLSFVAAALIVFPASTGARAASAASPFLKVGPRATLSAVTGPDFGLFNCQVGLDPTATCYDPFQIRHAYNIDTLISAGFDGRGRTIAIVDAFQSPRIVNELNAFDTFYGLPGLNTPRSTGNIGTFTQVAPDGLTPFDPANDDMVGWAEEIALDVEWAHAIAPNANIVLVLAKTDSDADILSATKFAVDNHLGDIISQSFGENESCVDPTILAQQHQMFADAR
jgi:subtilase family serine protease